MPDLSNIILSITEEPSMSDPAVAIPARVNSILLELDELMSAATKPNTQDLIAGERIGFGQMKTRIDLILSFIEARNPQVLRIVGGRH